MTIGAEACHSDVDAGCSTDRDSVGVFNLRVVQFCLILTSGEELVLIRKMMWC